MKSKLFTIVLMLCSSASAVSAAQFEYVTAGVDDAMRSVVANHLGIAVGDPDQTIIRLSSMALSDNGAKLAARVKVQTQTGSGWADVADFIAVITLDDNGRALALEEKDTRTLVTPQLRIPNHISGNPLFQTVDINSSYANERTYEMVNPMPKTVDNYGNLVVSFSSLRNSNDPYLNFPNQPVTFQNLDHFLTPPQFTYYYGQYSGYTYINNDQVKHALFRAGQASPDRLLSQHEALNHDQAKICFDPETASILLGYGGPTQPGGLDGWVIRTHQVPYWPYSMYQANSACGDTAVAGFVMSNGFSKKIIPLVSQMAIGYNKYGEGDLINHIGYSQSMHDIPSNPELPLVKTGETLEQFLPADTTYGTLKLAASRLSADESVGMSPNGRYVVGRQENLYDFAYNGAEGIMKYDRQTGLVARFLPSDSHELKSATINNWGSLAGFYRLGSQVFLRVITNSGAIHSLALPPGTFHADVSIGWNYVPTKILSMERLRVYMQLGSASGVKTYFVDFTNTSIGSIKSLESEMNTAGMYLGAGLEHLLTGGFSREGKKTISQAYIHTQDGTGIHLRTILIRKIGNQ